MSLTVSSTAVDIPDVAHISALLADARERSATVRIQSARILQRLRDSGTQLSRVSVDSRTMRPGDLFLALPGARADGRAHISDALRRGAHAVLWEAHGGDAVTLPPGVAGFAVPQLGRVSGVLAASIYQQPSESLWIAAVTGTNGKTSVSQWLAQALAQAGDCSAVIGTLGAGLAGEPSTAVNTTPEACSLQQLLRELVDRGAGRLAMEASSIGIEQGRIEGVSIDCAILTNFTRDHLDYHHTMRAYAEAKLGLFAAAGLTHAVCNQDDPLGERLLDALAGSNLQCIAYSLNGGPSTRRSVRLVEARHIVHHDRGMDFRLCEGGASEPVATLLAGRFNVANLLAVAGALIALDWSLPAIAEAMARLQPVPGRMQRVGGAACPLVLIDYAHTPDALANALDTAREISTARGGRLIVTFGCGGDRDRGKRASMGQLAAERADRVVLTSDNPRSESPQAIADDVVAGVALASATRRAAVQTELDRANAIELAIADAQGCDVVLVAGKGHEHYQEIGGVKTPFSDLTQAQQALSHWRLRQPASTSAGGGAVC